jgi:hypothetical protein
VFDKLVIVGVRDCLTYWLLWAWGRVWQTRNCGRVGEFDKLFIVGVGESLTNWLLWAGGSLTNRLLLA